VAPPAPQGGPIEWFRPTSGRLLGAVAIVGCAALLVAAVVDYPAGYALRLALASVFCGVLSWAALLRPRLGVTATSLVLRNMLETVTIPLVAVESLVVRQVLAVRAGDRRYVSPALGRTRRDAVASRSKTAAPGAGATYADVVEHRIRQLSGDARNLAGTSAGSEPRPQVAAPIHRSPAWPEVGALIVSGAGLLVEVLRR
jgi:hypothetical protein